ncbi:IS630 family transposase [Nocardioides sp. JQ2195]|uniref:IS630 family transposase n=1 Tax=Nocardioides sp. JQ2195 TaxID=2592334 RepID=UPI00143E621C|nr:IS630 family transposase [Nocardioides sp. JQ2195]QIX28731.1 IS630 family transposase [Nocardioides sp. JQ2195]
MGRAGRPTVAIELSEDERATLERWARRHSSSQALATRCRIVLAVAQGVTNLEAAAQLGISRATVAKWRHRFAADRLEGLVDAPRPGAARTIGDEIIEAVVVETLETAPKDATHWSTRSMAERHGISRQSVSEIWRAFGLKPWRQEEFKVSPDPELIEKVRDIVGLYLNPPVAAAVFAVDEKPQIQALNRSAPTLPMLPTTPAKATHDYIRNGTIDLFAALEIATGKVITDLRPSHTSAEFVRFLDKIDAEVPADLDVHVVLDNLSTHKTPAVHEWLLRHQRFHFHFTPTYGSWMNLVERWFSALTTKKLQRSAHRSVKALTADIRAWVETWNEDPKPFVWHKSADEILQRLAGYCRAINK